MVNIAIDVERNLSKEIIMKEGHEQYGVVVFGGGLNSSYWIDQAAKDQAKMDPGEEASLIVEEDMVMLFRKKK